MLFRSVLHEENDQAMLEQAGLSKVTLHHINDQLQDIQASIQELRREQQRP